MLPEKKTSKLAKLTAQKVLADDADLSQTDALSILFSEMEAEWAKDWSELSK